jgi:asparagine synthase (glutamine-hydrolysing)
MASAMPHRGPDDEGFLEAQLGTSADGGLLALGFRRLSIQDLSPLGHQPMLHPQTGDAIVFNGEIYNFKELRESLIKDGVSFRGGSDTEVLLHALTRWGTDCIADLAGMYAFAYYQARSRRLLLCRDPMGIKPLYTAATPHAVIAASEVRAVLASGLISRAIDKRGFAQCLAYGSTQEPLTFFESIAMFPPATYQWFDFAATGEARPSKPSRHWSFPATEPSLSEAAAVERLNHELTRSVRDHLTADVPVGVFLSSGLDSTIITGLAREVTSNVRTFTLGFLDQPDMSESETARESSRALGVQHHDIQLTAGQTLEMTRRWFESIDQPSADGLNTYVISDAVRQAGIVVALSGLGGDELFCGYPLFAELPRFRDIFTRYSWISPSKRRLLLSVLSFHKPEIVREKLIEMGSVEPQLLRLYLIRRRAVMNAGMHRFGLDARELGLGPEFELPEAYTAACELDEPGDPVAAVARMESAHYMRNVLLRDSDATSMARSLELRVPFLDRRVMDLAFAVPGNVRMPGPPNKHLLRLAFRRFLRPDILRQGKRGFVLPIRRWMQTSLRDICEDSLTRLRGSGLVNPNKVDLLWNKFIADPESRVWTRAFMMVVLGQYLRNCGQDRHLSGAREKPPSRTFSLNQ